MKQITLSVWRALAQEVTPSRVLPRVCSATESSQTGAVRPAPPGTRCAEKACPYRAAVIVSGAALCRHHARMRIEPHLFRTHGRNETLGRGMRMAGHLPPAP